MTDGEIQFRAALFARVINELVPVRDSLRPDDLNRMIESILAESLKAAGASMSQENFKTNTRILLIWIQDYKRPRGRPKAVSVEDVAARLIGTCGG